MDIARGVGYVEEEGDGDVAGEEYSAKGLVTLFGIFVFMENVDLEVSSSEVGAISTSRNSDERKDGAPSVVLT